MIAKKSVFISIVAPVYNEEEGIGLFYSAISRVLKKIAKPYEIIFVNDGSRDGSLELLRGFAKKNRNVRVVDFSRNFGHQIAITAGIDESLGRVVVTIDADLQDDPELILKMIKKWEKGMDVVYAKRKTRKDTFFKKITAAMFYRMLSRFSDIDIPLDTGDYRLMDRKVVDSLKGLREHSRFMRGLVTWVGFKQDMVIFDRGERTTGQTHYPLKKMIKLAIDGLLSFSHKPLKIATWIGFFSTVVGFLYAVYIIILKIIEPTRIVAGWPTIMIVILVMGGIQLLVLGVIGEYIGRIYTAGQKRPLYIIREKVNF